ncbi:LysR family transcriptional regulator [Psychromonas marina]|uniref:LysR family transcriptional regulator n=1 Tax=Psychromonas marina TaxID=88364 RepID=A0ABQ6DYN0_9GAMM|nr:LysR family transcriptional regulator [Psychromonas marina]GLS90205.1 LysR family transcriptional regulator [Psychromonas marina]
MLTSEDLRFFYTISTQPSLTAAARKLNVTPPSVTLRLQALESKVNVKLVQRQARGIGLTEEGYLLQRKAQFIIEEMNQIEALMASKKSLINGTLKVLAPLGFGNDYIAPLVAEFQQLHPNLCVELELSDKPSWAESHQWDLIIYIGKLRDSTLTLSVLAPNQRFLCASPDYLKRHGTPTSPRDLKKHVCISLRENSEDVTLWRFTHNTSEEQASVRITPTFTSNEGSIVKSWAMAGHGIIMRSEWDVQPELDSGALVRLLPEYRLPSADIVALLGTDVRSRSARTAHFLQLLKDRFAAQPWLKSDV